MTKHRRRTYLIKTGLQLRYMGIIISTMLMVAFGVGWITYDTSWSQIANTPDLTLDKLSVIFDSVNNLLLRWIGIFVLVIAALSILVSHKIAGPVYRLEETTKLIASGDLTHRIHLRQGDELRDLQDAFNKMSESLSAMINKDREIIERLVKTSNEIKIKIEGKSLTPDSAAQITEELNSIVEELRTITCTFKTEETESEFEKETEDSASLA
ncbi:MAG: methyl-accepting chemotaxis protein [Candidatus Riflebacteria bacterium]|nr:methyl-accepting chemotaxis protein [Candidatus Riflebacteria bacterium]MDD2624339.1 methyl-accepting chemotaxis protein [Candidatus Riflebacteria bacterium]MDD3375921.1 methyl-accepting chemotaxis protein [Candidatus Riflebacteria bacterium]NCB45593.1 methyl-accepting chemotaxis protein [bacterium]